MTNTRFVFIRNDLFRTNPTFWQNCLSENRNTITQNKEMQIFKIWLSYSVLLVGKTEFPEAVHIAQHYTPTAVRNIQIALLLIFTLNSLHGNISLWRHHVRVLPLNKFLIRGLKDF
jgi:hypothetical protein